MAWLHQQHWAALKHVSKTRTHVFQRVYGRLLVSVASRRPRVSRGLYGGFPSLPNHPPRRLKAIGSV